MRASRALTIVFLLAAHAGSALAATTDDLEQSFNPYRNGYPKFPGLAAGIVINKNNLEQFKDAIDPGLYLAMKDG